MWALLSKHSTRASAKFAGGCSGNVSFAHESAGGSLTLPVEHRF